MIMRRALSTSLLYVLFIINVHSQFLYSSSSLPKCHPDDSSALLQLKNSFFLDPTPTCFSIESTSSWKESVDCCKWEGITCDRVTGHVIGLDLGCSSLLGSISSNSSLFSLRHLQRLDLSSNDFNGSAIVPEFGQFKNMTHLDLSSSNFSSNVPLDISYLPKLVSLQLGYNKLKIGAATFKALAQNSTNIRELSLAGIDLSFVPSVYLMNVSSSLTSLHLSSCNLYGTLPDNVFRLSKLKELRLAFNILNGTIPSSIFSLPHLEILDLKNNAFSGKMGEFQSKSLLSLQLGNNKLQGLIPESLYQNVNLTSLLLSNNSLTGIVSFEKVSKLKMLSFLDLSSNNLSVTFNNSIRYTFSNLMSLRLSSCNIRSEFPNFLISSKIFDIIDLSSNEIQGSVPKWFWNVGKDSIFYLNLSHNSLSYMEPLPWKKLQILDLSSNNFSGPLPISSTPSLNIFLASKNKFGGDISTSFCNMTYLQMLDLSYNNLSGKIPPCMSHFSEWLSVLDLRSNKLYGGIHLTFPENNTLRNLNLNGNKFKGPVPKSLVNCTNLEVLDLGNNLLNGTFPYWLESLPNLQVLVLRSNKFRGSLANPKTRFSFDSLRILDLSTNEFTGALPIKFFENLKAMMDAENVEMGYMGDVYYQDSVMVTMKGFEIELVKIQTIFTTIDFSNNNFTGRIPELIGRLKSLKGLNFSHNKLMGIIPSSLGNLTNLEWLDLSSNKLHGKIPNDLLDLTFLSFLNLSNNRLEGPIPHGKQFETFGNNSFAGNLGLCGIQLSRSCNVEATNEKPLPITPEKLDGSSITDGFNWKIVMMGYGSGFVIGISIGYMLLYSDGKLSWLCRNILEKYQHTETRRPKKRRNAPNWPRK